MCTAVCNTDIRLLNGTAIDANKATGYGGGIYAYAIANTLSVTRKTALSVAILLPAVQASLPISLARRLSMWIFSPVL